MVCMMMQSIYQLHGLHAMTSVGQNEMWSPYMLIKCHLLLLRGGKDDRQELISSWVLSLS